MDGMEKTELAVNPTLPEKDTEIQQDRKSVV